VTQEALTNVVRHAGAAAAIVDVSRTATGVDLAVTDNGAGFDPGQRTANGLGLRSIDERVRLLRGQATVESRPGQGTMVLVRIPLASARVALSAGS
jgi:two-component system sensor histidine kinase UhpB